MKTNTKEASTKPNQRNNGTHRTHYTHLVTFPKAAFTLAEVLITLAIIGVVAAITIPSLVNNYNQRAWERAKDVFTKRLEVATKSMNAQEKLAGYSSTMDFVNELKNYIKITRVCDNNNITKCFNKEVIWNAGEDPIDMSEITSAESFGLDWKFQGTEKTPETVAVQFANGINAIIAYNPNVEQDPYDNRKGAPADSMAILYDVSGNKNPNTNGKDIDKINVSELKGVAGCMIPELKDTMCISQILAPGTGYSPMTLEECNQAVSDGELGIKACYYSSDYWAGAVKACGGIDNMPTMAQLGELATYVYNHDSTIGAQEDISSGLTLNTTKASQFLSASPGQSFGWFYVWSGQEYSSDFAYTRYFCSTGTLLANNYRLGSDFLAVCLDQ